MSSGLVVFSGGLDSSVALSIATKKHDEVLALTFDYSQRNYNEIAAAKSIAEKLGARHEVIKLNLPEFIKPFDKATDKINPLIVDLEVDSYIPNRNVLFATLAHAYALENDYEALYLGFVDARRHRVMEEKFETDLNEDIMLLSLKNSTAFSDATSSFFGLLKATLETSDKNCRIYAPLLDEDKVGVLEIAREHGILDFLLNSAVWCNNVKPCGECVKCAEVHFARKLVKLI